MPSRPDFAANPVLARSLAALLAAVGLALAQGAPAIYTLTEVAPGGAGYSALRGGAALAAGATAAYYNPALLGESHRSTGAHAHAAFSLYAPSPWLGDARFIGGAVARSDSDGFDWGLSLYQNRMDFGPVFTSEGASRSIENVYALAFGMRFSMPLSLGAAVKAYDSDFGAARAVGVALDFGALAREAYRPRLRGSPWIEIVPSAAGGVRNVGPDVVYHDPELKDPLPALAYAALGTEASFADVAALALGWDLEKDIHERADGVAATHLLGASGSVLGLRYSSGWRFDPDGYGFERHQAVAYEFDARRWRRVLGRWRSRDFSSAPEAVEAGFALPAWTVFGSTYRPDLGFVAGYRWVTSNSSVRDGTDAWYFALSL